jgi:hypothetical protein
LFVLKWKEQIVLRLPPGIHFPTRIVQGKESPRTKSIIVQGKESPRTKSILSLQLVSSHMLFIAVDLPSHAAEDNRRSFGGD